MIRGREKFISKLYMVVDFIFIQVAFLLAWIFRFYVEDDVVEGSYLSFNTYFIWNIVYSFIYILGSLLLKQYAPKRKMKFATEIFKITQVHILSIFILLGVLFTFKIIDISRLFLLYYLVICIIISIIYRYSVKQILRRLRIKGYNKQFILIVGAGTIGKN